MQAAGREGMEAAMADRVVATAAGAEDPEESEEDLVVKGAGLEGPEEAMVDRVVAKEAGVAELEARVGEKVRRAEV